MHSKYLLPALGALKVSLGDHELHESGVVEQVHLLKGLSSSDQLFLAWCTLGHMVQLRKIAQERKLSLFAHVRSLTLLVKNQKYYFPLKPGEY